MVRLFKGYALAYFLFDKLKDYCGMCAVGHACRIPETATGVALRNWLTGAPWKRRKESPGK
jgi:hypothetical protein